MKIKLICFDLDYTLINMSSWKELGLSLGVPIEVDRRLYKEYISGSLNNEEWNNILLEYYLKHKDANRGGITKILSKYLYNKGAREIIEYLKSSGYEIALISGSIDIIVDLVAKDLGIKYAKAHNSFTFDQSGRLKSIISDGDDIIAKAKYLEDFCSEIGIKINESACVADGENDIEMFRITGHGITFKGSIIENEAWKVIESLEDLKNIF